MGIQKIVGMIFMAIAVIGAIILATGQSSISETLPPTIICSVIGLILLIKKSKTKEEKEMIKENERQRKNYRETHIETKHQAGLPLATGVDCTVGYEGDRFCFQGGGNSFNLSCDKITDICIKTDIEIQKQYVSSVGGAVAGAVVFGPLGAIVGGRAKEKKSTSVTKYLIFTYLKEGQIEYISLEMLYGSDKAQKWIDIFKQNNRTAQGKTLDL